MTWETPAATATAGGGWNDSAASATNNQTWDAGNAEIDTNGWDNGNTQKVEPAADFNNGFGSGDARNYHGDDGDGDDGAGRGNEEEAWGHDKPARRDLSDMNCYNCQGMRHGSRNCTEPPKERDVRPLIDWSHVPEVSSDEAWNMLKKADASRDLDDIKEAFEIYAKNTPEATFQSIEGRLREEEMNLRLVAFEKEIPLNKTNVNLQMEADRKYVVGYQLSATSGRTRMNQGMFAASYEENVERLADAGFTVASSVPVCYNCNQKGHVGKNCPDGVPDPEDRDLSHIVKVICTNCEQEGHRLRTCPEPRKVRSRGCRNCGSEDHMVAECDQPKRPREGESCYNCGSEEHYGKDCTEEKKPRPDNRECYNCQQTGHIGKECPEPRKPRAQKDAVPVASSYDEPVANDYPAAATNEGDDSAPAWNTNEQPSWQTSTAAAVTAGGW